jgi:hypothetical protein
VPTKEGLLKNLAVKELRQLAKDNRITLKGRNIFGDTYPASTKEETTEFLAKSARITKEKISAVEIWERIFNPLSLTHTPTRVQFATFFQSTSPVAAELFLGRDGYPVPSDFHFKRHPLFSTFFQP